MTREEVVQAALTVERWCKAHMDKETNDCDCPFRHRIGDTVGVCVFQVGGPEFWWLENHLRTRGMKNGKQKKPVEFIPYTCKDCRQYPCAKHDENPDYLSRCDGFELW